SGAALIGRRIGQSPSMVCDLEAKRRTPHGAGQRLRACGADIRKEYGPSQVSGPVSPLASVLAPMLGNPGCRPDMLVQPLPGAFDRAMAGRRLIGVGVGR